MKQANVSFGDTNGHRASRKTRVARHLMLDSSASSSDAEEWNHSADFVSFSRKSLQHEIRGMRRPASEVQIRCCRTAALGRQCNCVSANESTTEATEHADQELLHKIELLSNHVQELELKEAALVNKVRSLKEEVAQKDMTVAELQAHLASVSTEKDAIERKATSFTHNVEILEAKIEEYKNNSKKVDELHVDKLSTTVKSLENLQQSFELERRKWQLDTKSLTTQLEESNTERQQLLKKYEGVKSQLDAALKEKETFLKEKADNMSCISRDLSAAKERIIKLESQLSGLDAVKSENAELKKQNSALRRQMDETYGQLVEHQLRQLNNTNDAVNVTSNTLLDANRTTYNKTHHRPSTASTTSSSSSVLSSGDLLAPPGHVSASNAYQNIQHNSQLLARVDALLGELRLSNGKYQLEHEKCLKLESNLKKAENDAEQARQTLEQCRKQLANKTAETENTLTEFFEVRNKLHSSVEQLGRDTEEISRLEKELKRSERELAKRTAEIEKLKQNAASSAGLQARLAEAEQLSRRFADEAEQRQLKIDQLSMQMDSLFDSRHNQRLAYEEQIEALRQEISRLSAECRSKAEAASNADALLKKMESEIMLLKKTMDQTKRNEALVRVEMESGYVSAQSEFVSKYQKLETALRETTTKLKDIGNEKAELEQRLDSILDSRDRRVAELEQLLKSEKAITEQRSAEVTSLTSALREKEKSLGRAQRRINDLESAEVRLQEQLTSLGQEMSSMRNREDKRTCELEGSNQKLVEQLAKADRLNHEQTCRISQLQSQILSLQKNCETTVEKYAELEERLVEFEGEKLKMRSEQEKLAIELAEKVGDEGNLQSRLDDLTVEIEAARRAIHEKDCLISSLENDCHALASRIDGMEEVRRVTAKAAEDFKRLVDDQNDKIYCLENQLAEKAEELRDVNAELRQRDAEMGLRRDQVFELESRVDGMRSDLETRIQHLEQALDAAQAELCSKITETTRLANELNSCQAELAQFREVDGRFAGELDAIKTDADEKKRLAIGWKKKYDKAEAERGKLESRVKDLESALASLQSESAKLRQEIQSQVSNVLSVQSETEAFRREVANSRTEISRLREELAQREEELRMAKAQSSRLGEELESMRRQKTALHDQLLASVDQLKKMKAQVAHKYEQQIRDLKLQNSILLNCEPTLSPQPDAEKMSALSKPSNTKFFAQFFAGESIGMASPDHGAFINDSSSTSPFFNNHSPPSPLRDTHKSLLIADSTTATEVDQSEDTSTVTGGSVDFSMASHQKLPRELAHKQRPLNSAATIRTDHTSKKSEAANGNWRPPLPRKK